ncbi:CHRD domain-containing protein [Chitinophaga alhagiae]|uniref:CHRD domain-containing protein n=1 Tax=Chitinophaga alhagiae TaxID=2203219 RepID=UPI000E5C3D32|nr:CHRD domain-containing protein [Chitinophaga alhagiae]
MKNSRILAAAGLLTLAACSKNNPKPDIIWSIPLSTKLENPTPAGRTETGLLTMQLYNKTLKYSFRVENLAADDQLTMAHFHTGDPVTNGPIILPFPAFSGTSASGEITLRQSLADSLKSTQNDIYFNVHSTQFPAGLVRGTVNSDIIMAADVEMNGLYEVPPVVTLATGRALVRLTIDRKLYSRVTVEGLPDGETLTAAHIHHGNAGANGAVLVGLCANAADFGISKMIPVDEATASALRTESLYTNVHTNAHPDGVIRGQVR